MHVLPVYTTALYSFQFSVKKSSVTVSLLR